MTSKPETLHAPRSASVYDLLIYSKYQTWITSVRDLRNGPWDVRCTAGSQLLRRAGGTHSVCLRVQCVCMAPRWESLTLERRCHSQLSLLSLSVLPGAHPTLHNWTQYSLFSILFLWKVVTQTSTYCWLHSDHRHWTRKSPKRSLLSVSKQGRD